MTKDLNIPIGHHITLDLFGCECPVGLLRELHLGAMFMEKLSKFFNHLGEVKHQFRPESYSICVLLEESHLSIHTWTQHKFASLDLYTCRGDIPEDAVKFVLAHFKPQRAVRVDVVRGTTNPVTRTETDYKAA